MNKQNILNINKRMLGKKVFVINDYMKYNGYVGTIIEIVNDNLFKVQNENEINDVSIYDIRNIPYEF